MTLVASDKIDLDRLRTMRKNLREITEHPGWPVVLAYIGAKQDALVKALVLNPLKRLDEALESEYLKGKYAALDEVVNHPADWLTDLDAQIAALEVIEQREKKEPANADRPVDEGTANAGRRSP